jgi:hypothetical protein
VATRIEFPPLAPSLAALPFLFMGARPNDRDWQYNAALASAAAAESANVDPANSRRRVAFLLCEFGCQYGRRTGDFSAPMPLSRGELARALGISLCRVKRILALLSLSQVVALEGESLRILDWRRLCALGDYDTGRLGFELPEEEDVHFVLDGDEEAPAHLTTSAGDPAYFG